MPESASPAPLRKTYTPASRPVPPPIDPAPVPPPVDGDWQLPIDTWEPTHGYGDVSAARRQLDRVRDRIDRNLDDLRRAIDLRQRQLPGWQFWGDDTLSNLRRAETALREAKRDAELADRDLRDGYSNLVAERRIDALTDRLAEADAYLAVARPAGRTRDIYRDGDREPLDPGTGGTDRPVPPPIDGRSPQGPERGRPGYDRPTPPPIDGRTPGNGPRTPAPDRSRPVPPSIGRPGDRYPRDPQNPLDPGPSYPGRPIPVDPRPGRPVPVNPRPGRPIPVDPRPGRPIPGPSYPWPSQPPFWREDLGTLIDRLRWDIRTSIDDSRRAREYLRRELPEPWQPRPEPPPTWPYFDGISLLDGEAQT